VDVRGFYPKKTTVNVKVVSIELDVKSVKLNRLKHDITKTYILPERKRTNTENNTQNKIVCGQDETVIEN
jgi:hypothetical protein